MSSLVGINDFNGNEELMNCFLINLKNSNFHKIKCFIMDSAIFRRVTLKVEFNYMKDEIKEQYVLTDFSGS